MAEQAPHSDDTGRESPPRMPRWVKAAVIIVGVVLALFVVLKLTGVGGAHGPGRHMSGPGTPPPGQSLVTSSSAPDIAG